MVETEIYDVKIEVCVVFSKDAKRSAVSLPRIKCLDDVMPKKYFLPNEVNRDREDEDEPRITTFVKRQLIKPPTPRENQVYEMLKAMSVSEVAGKLKISKSAVRAYKWAYLRKSVAVANSGGNNDGQRS